MKTAKCPGGLRVPALIGCTLLATAAIGWSLQPYKPAHPDPALESWRWRSFAQLKGKGVRCMAQDSEGAMWFGVDQGAMRYDGLQWQHHSAKDGPGDAIAVRALCAAQNGAMYAATERGINHFDGESWRRLFPDLAYILLPCFPTLPASRFSSS